MKLKIYHPTEGERWLSSVDWSSAWQKQGWSRSPVLSGGMPPEVPPTVTEEKLVTNPRDFRKTELKAMSWADIREIAEGHGIVKPVTGWMDAIPLILDAEYGDPV